MNFFLVFGISTLFICFTIATFFLSRIPQGVLSDNYEFKLDPFWTLWGVMLFGALGVYTFFPENTDMIKNYGYIGITLPFVFSALIYFSYMLGIKYITSIVILLFSVVMSFLQPDTFCIIENIPYWADRLIVALIIFIVSRGLGLINGLGALSSMQFIAVMIVSIVLAHLGAAPQLLAMISAAYLGTMLAFTFFSYPPEKLIITYGGFSSIGFIMACFMLDMSVEYSEISMMIAVAYLLTEVGFALYNRIILNEKYEQDFLYTSYYKISNAGEYEKHVVYGIFKIFIINIVLAIMQTVATERVALLVFSIAVNIWMLSVVSGEAKFSDVFSVTKWSFRGVKKIISKKSVKKQNNVNNTPILEDEEVIVKIKKAPSKKTKTTTKNTTKAKTTKMSKSSPSKLTKAKKKTS